MLGPFMSLVVIGARCPFVEPASPTVPRLGPLAVSIGLTIK